MPDENATAAEVAQATLNSIKQTVEYADEEHRVILLSALIESPNSISELGRLAGDPDCQIAL